MDVSETTNTGTTQDGRPDDQTAKAQAKDKAQDLAGQAREQADRTAEQARGTVRDQVEQRSSDAGRQISSQASDLRAVAESLREQGKDQPAKLAQQAAERAERLGSYLEQSDADRILHDVEDFARRRPWAVGLGAAALGFAGARFLKASSSERYQSGPPARQTQAALGTGPGAGTPGDGSPGSGPPTAHPAAGGTSGDGSPGV